MIVIGGGAAGFFCAINAARMCAHLDVMILEKTTKLLSKVRISGGGRCNVTHHENSIAEMVKNYPRGHKFLKKGFHHFFTNDTIEWFESRGVRLKTESDGRMFPVTEDSETIIDCFLKEANKYHVAIHSNKSVCQIKHAKNNQFQIITSDEELFTADFVCIACGGFPKLEQYKWLADLGHTFEPPVPSLFTFNLVDKRMSSLMGIAINNVAIKISGTKYTEQGPLLITHWGFSGPAVLKLSSKAARYLAEVQYDFRTSVNWISGFNENTAIDFLKEQRQLLSTRKIHNRNPFGLPQRFWEFQLAEAAIQPEMNWASLPSKNLNALAKNLCTQAFAVKGKTTFKEEFVTAGGINLEEINHSTLESKLMPNLFFAGEIINVDALTGGFNFQNAWTTGWIAAKEISCRSESKN